MVNKKMLLAPILAIALVLSLAAAVSYLPLSSQTASQNQQLTQNPMYTTATPAPEFAAPSNEGAPYVPAPSASAAPAPSPTAVPASTLSSSPDFLPVLFVIVAVVIGIAAVQVLFSEKGLKKELSDRE